jgi:hypothetical protein
VVSGQKVLLRARPQTADNSAHWEVLRTARTKKPASSFSVRKSYLAPGRFQVQAVLKGKHGHSGAKSDPHTIRVAVQTMKVPDFTYPYWTLFERDFGIFWHPDLGAFTGSSIEDKAAGDSQYSIKVMGPTGPPEGTRIAVGRIDYVPSSGLTPASYTQRVLVYNPWTRRIERDVVVAQGLDIDQVRLFDWQFLSAAGNVFSVATFSNGVSYRVGVDMASGTVAWAMPSSYEFGSSDTTFVANDDTAQAGAGCGIDQIVASDTGAVLRAVDLSSTFDGKPYCLHDAIGEGNLLWIEGVDAPDQAYSVVTGQPVVVAKPPAAGELARRDVVYDVASGLVGYRLDDGTIMVTRGADGSTVYSLPAEQAAPVEADILALTPTTLWLSTTDQFLRVDLGTGSAVVTREPVFEVGPIANHWTLYTNHMLRRDRY